MLDITLSGVSIADHFRDLTDMQDDLARRVDELATRVAVLEPSTPPVVIPPVVVDPTPNPEPVPGDDFDPPHQPPTNAQMPRRHLLMAGDNWPQYPYPNFQFVSVLYQNQLFTPNKGRVPSQVKAHGEGAPWGLKTMFPTFGAGAGIEVTRQSHPMHNQWRSRVRAIGAGIADAQADGLLPKGFAVTVNHEFFGGFYAKNWSLKDSTTKPDNVPYKGHNFTLLADNIAETADMLRVQGADVRVVLSPNTLRNEGEAETLADLTDELEDYVGGLGLSWYVLDGSKTPRGDGYQDLENQLRLLTDISSTLPLYINECGFNPTNQHVDFKGNLQVTNAPDRLGVINSFWSVINQFPNVVGVWYFNRNKVVHEDYRLFDDGSPNPNLRPEETKSFTTLANRWLNGA